MNRQSKGLLVIYIGILSPLVSGLTFTQVPDYSSVPIVVQKLVQSTTGIGNGPAHQNSMNEPVYRADQFGLPAEIAPPADASRLVTQVYQPYTISADILWIKPGQTYLKPAYPYERYAGNTATTGGGMPSAAILLDNAVAVKRSRRRIGVRKNRSSLRKPASIPNRLVKEGVQ